MEIIPHDVKITDWKVTNNSKNLSNDLNVSCSLDTFKDRTPQFVITIKWFTNEFSANQEFSVPPNNEINDEDAMAEYLHRIVNFSRLKLENSFNERAEKEGIKVMLLTTAYSLEDVRRMIP